MPPTALARVKGVPGALALLVLAGIGLLAITLLPPLPEPQSFQGLADKRSFLGIPNFMNVVSNVPFLLVGAWALRFIVRDGANGRMFADLRERWPYLVCFFAVACTSVGSSYYHLEIDRAGLFWDRLPMAIGFMAVFAAVIVERVNARLGLRLLVPLLLLGAASVIYWRWSALYATENLLPYALVQYGSIAAVLVLCGVYRSRYTHGAYTVHVVAIYGLAKLAEVLDWQIYALGGLVSGHTLKHLIAAFATFWLGRMLYLRSIAAGRP